MLSSKHRQDWADELLLLGLLTKEVWHSLLLSTECLWLVTEYLWLISLPEARSNKLSRRLLSKLKLRCCSCKLLLRCLPLSILYWLIKSGCDYRLECVLCWLLESVKCGSLGSEWLLLRLCESIERSLRLAKVYSLRCRRSCSIECCWLVERGRACLLEIQSRLTRRLLERIILRRLLSEQILGLVCRVAKRTWLLSLWLVEVKGLIHVVDLFLSLLDCLLKWRNFRVWEYEW